MFLSTPSVDSLGNVRGRGDVVSHFSPWSGSHKAQVLITPHASFLLGGPESTSTFTLHFRAAGKRGTFGGRLHPRVSQPASAALALDAGLQGTACEHHLGSDFASG